MKCLTILIVFLVTIYSVNGRSKGKYGSSDDEHDNGEETCMTASGVQGYCTSLYKCPSLKELVEKQNKTEQETEVVRRSLCGFDGEVPAVCCSKKTELPLKPISCYTPEGKPGLCISIHSCPQLKNLLRPPVPEEHIHFLERSKCYGSDKYSVCCGPVPSLKDIPKSKCSETVTSFPPDPRTGCCGVDAKFESKIIGGTAATIDQYPWLVLIEYEKNGIVKTGCGGALISGKYVLTAGHCVIGDVLYYSKPKNVRLGEYNTTQDGPDHVFTDNGEDFTDGTTIIPIEKTIPYPQYNPIHPQKKHDIALIRMKEKAPFTEFIRPICLPISDITLRDKHFNLTVAGWGATSAFNKSSPIKQHVELPFVNTEQCQREYMNFGRHLALWKGQLCAGGEKGKDSCKGDSGGPLMFENVRSRTYEITGIVSFGLRALCGLEHIPGVYTSVHQYLVWIRSNIVP